MCLLVAMLLLVLGGATPVRAQPTGPVLHLDELGLFFTLDDPDTGQVLAVLLQGNPGDFLRFNPDGSVQVQMATNDALVLLFDRDPFDPDRKVLLGGSGSGFVSAQVTCDLGSGICFYSGERTVIQVQAELAPAPDADPVATVFAELVLIRQEQVRFTFEIEPL
jgi:hypothetical protein